VFSNITHLAISFFYTLIFTSYVVRSFIIWSVVEAFSIEV